MVRTSLPPPPPVTRVEVVYPAARGTIGLRGSQSPLSWEHTEPPIAREGDRHLFEIRVPPGEIVELKVVRNDEEWAGGRNYAVHAGDDLVIEPWFDASAPKLEPLATVAVPDLGDVAFEVLLPPSWNEQTSKRYPVVYVLDGQSLWTTSSDPFGTWGLDATLGALYDLGAIEELIVVGVHTAEDRVARLSPVPDATHGGGGGKRLLDALVGPVRELVDGRYRTLRGRDDTAIMGSSMGGLFAFFAAWSRSDVFGKAACLSSSFWWADRWAVRFVQERPMPEPRAVFYVDSGASTSALEQDANLRDGFHHTRAMLRAMTATGYVPGVDLHRLVFAGARHDAGSWATRVTIPLQLLFPPRPRTR